ncbi:hypothetical protein MKK84_24620 [Methylobacterium sp. E-065]|uniref:hypothetical protein n=1 Tax=Methylobacterium sp. E-065 TaxID=2836583 RepID=UPI001FB9001C|nr:hypothetical protein [Methylobacterium sp. E-065]MCJ2020573.1 hypothetical protein [Methylobacterium sp. E-065]
MAAPLSRGSRIGRPRADGSLLPGTVLGPAFGEGFYRVELRGEDGPRIACLHMDEVVVEPAFGDLRAVAAAMRACDRAPAPIAQAAGPRRVVAAF